MSPFVRRPSLRPADRLVARAVLLLSLALYLGTCAGAPDVADAEIEYQTTSALARTGSFALGGTPEAERVVAHARSVPMAHAPVRLVEAEDGVRAFAWYGVGQAAAALPLYAIGRALSLALPAFEERHAATAPDGAPASEYFPHVLVGARNALLGAATAWLLVLAALRMGVGRRASFLAGLAYAVTSYAWPQARSSLSGVQATFFLVLAFHLVLAVRERLDRHERPEPRLLVGIGAALAAALLTRVAALGACLVVGAAAETTLRVGFRTHRVRAPRPRRAARIALAYVTAPMLVGIAVFLWTNWVRFGDPFDSGYGPAVRRGLFSGDPLVGAAGLLASPGRGLVWFAPLVLLVPVGFARAWRQGERLWPLTTVLVLGAVLAPAASMPGWHGAWTYGPRYLLPALPFLFLGVALAFDVAARRPWLRRAAAALAALGLAVQLPATLVDHQTQQDLAIQAARVAWPDGSSLGLEADADERDVEEARFRRTLWSWRFAAPWAHWRVFRHRVADEDESFPVGEIYFLDSAAEVEPTSERLRGAAHLGWVDFVRRLEGSALLPVLLVGGLLALGAVSAARGLDPAAP